MKPDSPPRPDTPSDPKETETKKITVSVETGNLFDRLRQDLDFTDDKLALRLLDIYNSHHREIQEMSKQLRLYKEREIQAFSIGDAISDGIYVVDFTGTILEVNTVFCELTGLTSNAVVGRKASDLVVEGVQSRAVCQVVLEKKEKITEMTVMNQTGKRVLTTGNPYFDDQGKITQVLVVMRDITELIKLKEELEETEKVKERYLNELNYLRGRDMDGDRFVGQSLDMVRIGELVEQISEVASTVLITGETGVGKEVIARYIYTTSRRNSAPYVRINCAAMPESLIESELFGYEKGAFTGARERGKPGMFELANKGTILLDEIGDMSMGLQPKLLRVLQEKEVTRIGGTKPIIIDVRVITTTNQDLNSLIKNGRFRKDLFYRLNVIPIDIPPLRERKEDIPLLVTFFLKQYNAKYGKKVTISPVVLDVFQSYQYPGNVRELKNIVERLVVTASGLKITAESFHTIVGLGGSEAFHLDQLDKLPLKDAVNRFEKQIIERALKQYGSTHKAAKALGISQPTVVRKSRALGIENW